MTDRKEYMRLYRLKNKEKIKEYAKSYFQDNKDEIMEKRQSETYKQSQKNYEKKRYTPQNYSNSIIYKIVCNDSSIIDCYVGSTIKFKSRESQHKGYCNYETRKQYNYKLYSFIRENGGWENWTMIEIEKYPCETKMDLLAREKYYYDMLKPTLNSISPKSSI